MECQYSERIIKNALEQYLLCKLTHKYCLKQKFCHLKQMAINTNDYETCLHLVRKGDNNGKEKK